MLRASSFVVLALGLATGCDGGAPTASGRPCAVSAQDMASIWEVPAVAASPQDNGVECIYAADNEPIVALRIRSPEEFDAERARFEDRGVLLPPLEPVGGFEGEANVDPRYDSLNVFTGDVVVSVELLRSEPAGRDERLAIEKRIAQTAISSLE